MIITEKEDLLRGKVLIEFYADWCGPCRIAKPIVEEFGKNSKDVSVYFCNVDEDRMLSNEHMVRSIPALVYMENGEVIDKKMGIPSLNDLKQMTNS